MLLAMPIDLCGFEVVRSDTMPDDDFIKYFESKVRFVIDHFQLFKSNDRIFVAASGGKDSTVCLYLLKKFGYDIQALTIDVMIGKYTKDTLRCLQEFCGSHNIRLHVVSFREMFGYSLCYLQTALKGNGLDVSSCSTCSVLRRSLVNKNARSFGASLVVTGHNLDDECQQILMNLFRNTPVLMARMGPKPGIRRIEGFIPRVKPLYLATNAEVERYSRIMKFPVEYGECPCAKDAFRRNIKHWMNRLEKDDPMIKYHVIGRFLSALPSLREDHSGSGSPSVCSICGEPSSKQECQSCRILSFLKADS